MFSFLNYLASLIKTIIGGAQIIDLMILVVDITKGIQTQTAECLVIGEITCSKMIVVLNKIDSVPADKRNKTIEKVITVWNIQGENPKKETGFDFIKTVSLFACLFNFRWRKRWKAHYLLPSSKMHQSLQCLLSQQRTKI